MHNQKKQIRELGMCDSPKVHPQKLQKAMMLHAPQKTRNFLSKFYS